MNGRVRTTVLAVAAAGGIFAAAKKPVFLNIDDTHFFASRTLVNAHPDEKEIRHFVGQYAGSDVSDVMMCVSGRISDVPSKVRMSWLDKYAQTNENGIAVDYRAYLRIPHEIWEVKKLDPFKLWIDEAHRHGIKLWFSVRMNDCHCNNEPTSFLHSDYFHDHPEVRRVVHRPPVGYFDRNFDYGRAEVRRRVLAYLEEVLMNYGPDGLELDWLREAYCFQIGRENAATMTALLRDVKALADTAAKKFGHPIPLAVRVPPDPVDALEFGFDVGAWAQEGLVAVVSPCNRWATTNMDVPVVIWKRLLHGTDVVLAPGVELLIRPSPDASLKYTEAKHVFAHAAVYYSAGADGIALYNYFDDPAPEIRPFWGARTKENAETSVFADVLARILEELGDPDAVLRERRQHMITWNDIRPVGRAVCSTLPCNAKKGGFATFRVPVGKVPPGGKVEVRFGAAMKDALPPVVYVNSRPTRYLRSEPCAFGRVAEPLYVYAADGFAEDVALIEVQAKADMRVTFCAVDVVNMPKR